jgi:DNA polymerase-3 subunit epsilon
MLATAPRFCEVAKKIWTLTEGAVFVAHSVNFDYSFIREEFKSLGGDFKRQKLCTVRLSRKVFPGLASYSLGNICKQLGIEITNRHRAMGDAAATVRLLELCLLHDKDNFFSRSLKKSSHEALLPPHLPIEAFNRLPDRTGVYYFHNEKGDIIYVGKAINIRKRVLSHFSGPATSRLSFISSIADITFTLCGTELIALLLESSEIKRLFPLYNQAQKFERNNYILTEYTDQKGIRHLLFTRNNKKLKAITHFRSFDSAREFIFKLIREHKLCPKFCGLYSSAGPCLDSRQGNCNGICDEKEDVKEYNKRVNAAIRKINKKLQTNLIIDSGRSFGEKSVVLIEEGVYKGFGYFSEEMIVDTPEKAKAVIQPFKHNPDVQRILDSWT